MKLLFFNAIAITAFSMALSSAVRAQDANIVTPVRPNTKLSNPPPSGFEPIAVSTAEAKAEATTNAEKVGLSAAYFTKQDLINLLSDSRAVGIRFYNAMESSSSGVMEMLAVAVKSDGTEINPLLSRSCVLSQSISKGLAVKVITRTMAKTYVENAYNRSGLATYTAFFPRSAIENILARFGAVGIKLFPASRRFEHRKTDGSIEVTAFYTMTTIGVSKVNDVVVDVGGPYFKSLEPCPYLCPDDKHLLMPARY